MPLPGFGAEPQNLTPQRFQVRDAPAHPGWRCGFLRIYEVYRKSGASPFGAGALLACADAASRGFGTLPLHPATDRRRGALQPAKQRLRQSRVLRGHLGPVKGCDQLAWRGGARLGQKPRAEGEHAHNLARGKAP